MTDNNEGFVRTTGTILKNLLKNDLSLYNSLLVVVGVNGCLILKLSELPFVMLYVEIFIFQKEISRHLCVGLQSWMS